MTIRRRSFLIGSIASLLAAPPIVRASSLMPVRVPRISAASLTWIDGVALTPGEQIIITGCSMMDNGVYYVGPSITSSSFEISGYAPSGRPS